ncbi:TIGR04066 family peptide maturation system protein [Paenibacillus sp. CAA11]|uniref:TIGR04066 family peptide maturation system protein n=1 Tax=Paenibacillus sp. CAA11 TaxID=1532905 RepID=UPI00131EE19C|nr:TIGR04066 family peptide maturation system protein [Paenibacillus sp. CAA11]
MDKLLFFPCCYENISIVRYRALLTNYELVTAIVPKGRYLSGKDASAIDGGEHTGFELSDDFEGKVAECDTVLFLEGLSEKYLNSYVKKIEWSQQLGKRVVISEDLNHVLESHGYIFDGIQILTNNHTDHVGYLNRGTTEGIYPIHVPIVSILGLGRHCNKFNIQLELGAYFKQTGYKVLQLGTKKMSELFGFRALPEFLYNNSLSVTDRVLAFNHYVYQLSQTESPDLIIVGYPGGILPIDDLHHNDYGTLPFILSNALQTDIGILSLYYNPGLTEAYFKEFQQCCKYRFNIPVNYFHISNSRYLIDDNNKQLSFLHLKDTNIKEKISTIPDVNLFNTVHKLNSEKIYNTILTELTSNLEFV